MPGQRIMIERVARYTTVAPQATPLERLAQFFEARRRRLGAD
jgi:hypothetical protein